MGLGGGQFQLLSSSVKCTTLPLGVHFFFCHCDSLYCLVCSVILAAHGPLTLCHGCMEQSIGWPTSVIRNSHKTGLDDAWRPSTLNLEHSPTPFSALPLASSNILKEKYIALWWNYQSSRYQNRCCHNSNPALALNLAAPADAVLLTGTNHQPSRREPQSWQQPTLRYLKVITELSTFRGCSISVDFIIIIFFLPKKEEEEEEAGEQSGLPAQLFGIE